MEDTNLTVSEKDNSVDSSTETNQGAETASSERENTQTVQKEPPFHEHPRWKEMQERDKAREQELKELREFRQKSEPLLSKFQPDNDVRVPAWFGGDAEAWKLYQEDQKQLMKSLKDEAVKEFETKTQKERETLKAAQEHIEKSLEKLTSEGKKFDKNKLFSITEKYRLVDDKGNWNLEAGYEIYEAFELKNAQAKEQEQEAKSGRVKELISISKSDKSADEKPRDYKTNADFERGKPW